MVKKVRIPIRIQRTVSYRYYICSCGRKVIPVSNPSRCPYCSKITPLKG